MLTGSLDDDSLGYDADATAAERAGRPAASEAFFDRGPGYARLAGGARARRGRRAQLTSNTDSSADHCDFLGSVTQTNR